MLGKLKVHIQGSYQGMIFQFLHGLGKGGGIPSGIDPTTGPSSRGAVLSNPKGMVKFDIRSTEPWKAPKLEGPSM